MKDSLINVNKVSKKYHIGERGYRSLREDIVRLFKSKKLDDKNKILWALKDVSFDVKKGEALGIIGANGAGKSTILKLLANVTLPTSGHISIKGKLGALIELTAGFHPELTGRENIYLYGSIKGMKKSEIDKKFDEIVAFSGLEKFIDTPIKRYSSGMHARLGFSVSAHINPDVLIIDEVLSVGDISFQRKCLDHMSKIRNMDKAIIFVSHNLSAIRGLCDRVIWLDKGEIKKEGDPLETISAYAEYMASKSQFCNDINYIANKMRWGTGEMKLKKIKILNSKSESCNKFIAGDKIKIVLEYHAYKKIESPLFWICIINDDEVKIAGTIFNKLIEERKAVNGEGAIECMIDSKALQPGKYHLIVGVYDEYMTLAYDRIGRASTFNIVSSFIEKKYKYGEYELNGVVWIPTEWRQI